MAYYCIPWKYVCNGRQDCPLGDDEEACTEFHCDGLFKCLKTDVQFCVHYSDISLVCIITYLSPANQQVDSSV